MALKNVPLSKSQENLNISLEEMKNQFFKIKQRNSFLEKEFKNLNFPNLKHLLNYPRMVVQAVKFGNNS